MQEEKKNLMFCFCDALLQSFAQYRTVSKSKIRFWTTWIIDYKCPAFFFHEIGNSQMSYVTTTFKVVTLLRKLIEVDMCTSVMLREGGLKSVHFKKTVARISIVVLFVLICI